MAEQATPGRRRGGLGLAAAGVAVGVAIAVWQVVALGAIDREDAIWDAPTSAESEADVGGSLTRVLFFHSYTLDVTFATVDGVVRKPAELVTLGAMDRSQAPRVRFDPHHPDHFALSWAHHARAARRAAALALLGGGIGFALALLGIGARRVRRAAPAAQVGKGQTAGG